MDRKTMQVCTRVMQTLCSVFGSEVEDVRLSELVIVAVEPAPDASRLAVTCLTKGNIESATLALDRARGFLRSEIAHALQRKRAPELCFFVLPEDARRQEDEQREGAADE